MNDRDGIAFRALGPFLLITFGLAWSILGLYVFLPEPMASAFGPLTGDHPLFFLAVWAPAMAALVLVARAGGRSGLQRSSAACCSGAAARAGMPSCCSACP